MPTPHPRSLRLGLVPAALLVIACSSTSANAQTTLRWKLQKGEKLIYSMDQRVVTKVAFGPQKFESNMNQMIDSTWEVGESASNGGAQVFETIDRIRFTVDQAGQKMQFDSKDGKVPEGPFGQAYGPIFGAMTGSKISFQMSAQGDITDVKLPEKMVEAVRNVTGGAGQMFGEENIKKMFTHSTLTMPSKPVSKGESWNKETDVDNPIYKMKLNNVYTFQGPAEGSKLQQIDVTIQTTIVPPASGPTVKLKSQESKGKFLFDNDKGRLVESGLLQKMELVVSQNNMESTAETTTEATMKLNPAASN